MIKFLTGFSDDTLAEKQQLTISGWQKRSLTIRALTSCLLPLTSYLLPLTLFLLPLTSFSQFYNGSQQEFGKNRVQYDEPRQWTWYKFEKFDCYFYKNGKELAEFVSRNAEADIAEIEKTFDFQIDDKIQFMIFNKQSEFKQSNLGLASDEQYNIGGVTRIVGSKVSLYFNGDHTDFERQMRAGIAEVVINQMMYGGNVKEMLKNSTFLTLPDWYVQGLVSYISDKWDADIDNRVRDGISSGNYFSFNRLSGQDAIYAGHSIWNYIAETYGEGVISNILYMTKVSRNVESAFLFVLGTSVKNLTYDWMEFYSKRYNDNDRLDKPVNNKPIVKKVKASRVYGQFRISPDGQYAIYTTNELGQYKVWLYDFSTGKTKRIMKREHKLDRINDYSYPLLAWHPSGKLFTIIGEEKGELHMTYYTIDKHKKEMLKIFNFEKIVDFSYSPDGKKLVMSAVNKGISDIYVYNIAGGGLEQITKDVYDDLTPHFVNNGEKIIFCSNRPYDSLKTDMDLSHKGSKYKDLFLYNYKMRSNVLKRVTETPLVNEYSPSEFDSTHIAYISDDNGIRNRYIASFDSAISYIDTAAHYRYITQTSALTNYDRGILDQDVNTKVKKITEVIYTDGKYQLIIEDLPVLNTLKPLDLKNTFYRELMNKRERAFLDSTGQTDGPKTVKVILNQGNRIKKDTTGGFDINNYTFDPQVDHSDTPKKQEPKPEVKPVTVHADGSPDTTSSKAPGFILPVMRNYNVFFSTDYVVSQIDNTFLNSNYQKFNGASSPLYLNPGFTGLFKIGMSDLFEDYRIVAGMRLSGDLNSNEYFISYENRLHRIDRQLVLHRQALLDITQGSYLVKLHTHEVKYRWSYPFSEVASLRTTLNGRMDGTVFPATDLGTLPMKNKYEYSASAKVEYVFDNTIKRGLNLYNGIRFKVFGEYYHFFKQSDTINVIPKLHDKGDMIVVGVDFRYYKKIHRDIIWANRIAASTSFGKNELIYYMGGVDNWLSPRFNFAIPVSSTEPYAYQTLATPMRGFWQNARNGNSFVVINSEIRVPLFRYLSTKPIRSDFLNNFQVIGFGDIGTAWNGPSPYSDDNSLNTTYIGAQGNPITVILKNQREPIIGGYGFGLRSRILGYFVRVDWAWGVEDGHVLPKNGDPNNRHKPTMVYLSFSLDF